MISLSILEYERELSTRIGSLEKSKTFSKIIELADSGLLYSIHIDVMRPPLIPNKITFPLELIREIYLHLQGKIKVEIHLMVKNPEFIIHKINEFAATKNRENVVLIIQREAYSLEDDVVNSLRNINSLGYKAGIGLNFPTNVESLTDEIIKNSDLVLIMSVPMGKGGQKYGDEATKRIKGFAKRFPKTSIKVDGGINDNTINTVRKAGAKILVIGSFITRNKQPLEVLKRIRITQG